MNSRMTFILVACVSLGCRTELTAPHRSWINPDFNWSDFSVVQTSYDTLLVSSSPTFTLYANQLALITAALSDEAGFSRVDTIPFTSTFKNDRFVIDFRKAIGVPLSIRHLRVQLLLHGAYGTPATFDTLIPMYKYPYRSAEIFLPEEAIPGGTSTDHIQDFTLCSQYLFFHPVGAMGLFRYDLSNGQLIHYSRFSAFIGGDYMASDTLQTYADVNGYGILRHDLIRDTTDLEFDFNQLPFVVQKTAAINGIHIDADHVLTFLQSNKGIMLVTFDRDGQLLSYMRWSGPFPAYLTFDGPVLYSYGYQNTLVRYDTLSHQFLTPRMCPSWGTAGLRIYGPYLYYVDDWRQMIGRVLLDEVKAADF